MLAVLAAFAVGALVVPVLARRFGRAVFPLAALVPAAAFGHALTALPAVLDGATVTEITPWVPQLGLALSFRIDALALLLVLVVTGVGALVFLYCTAYFTQGDAGVGRFAGILLAFAGSMYGLVLADDVYLLFAFWEATSVFSYLLIGHNRGKRASRTAALQALLVTTLGGLVMLVGLVLLSHLGGSTSLSELIANPPQHELVPAAIVLILVGVLSKSAIVPFHFWLPGAMAAPTPVSAYLHAAAMVKAGIYLTARLAPGYADVPGWREILVGLGLVTLLVGAVQALRQTDLKLLLAHGTVSQLGLLVVIAGWGGAAGGIAAVLLLLAHALFKSALFLIVGIVDHGTGTRDLRRITGFGRRAPVLAAASAAAVLSMAGLPIAFGFVAKEAVLTVLVDAGAAGEAWGWITLAGVAAGSALTLAYGIRFVWGAFADKAGVDALPAELSYPRGETAALFVPPVALAGLGLLAGPFASVIDPLAQRIAAAYPDAAEAGHVEFWHGLEPALGVSALIAGVGVLIAGLLARRMPADALSAESTWGARAYRATLRGIDTVSAVVTGLTQRGSLPFYLAVILLVAVASTWAVLPAAPLPASVDLFQHPAQPVIGALMIAAAIAATVAGKRFQAVVLVGVTGIGMAALFAIQGAPDLAITQVLIEIVTLVVVVLVLRRLPARLGAKHGSSHRVLRALLGVAVGLTMAAVVLVATGSRVAEPISAAWPELAVEIGHGYNVVNVALVDMRGWDTMGELTVVIAAATGVASLIFIRTRADDLPRVSRRRQRESIRERRAAAEAVDGRGSWLLAGRTLAPHNRSILLEVVVRLLFHALIVVSIYLLLVGHNAVGGGFAGGLVAGLALIARYLAGGRHELAVAAPFDAGKVLGAGLVLAAGAATVPLLFGAAPLTSAWFTLDLGPVGSLDVVSSTVFDIGVYLVVIGLVVDVLRSLGAELDRQQESDADEKALA
ncbi:Na+/H+ antiporter subunit A [Pseudolysinimonas sp.]|jgi:multicomponent Na+:H+ antiporter subunit A|uniref:Na+/H+ antiporter subunit A n=1 Tax=Pseudolysinimonas sp. TaxID=2680009 RepID=UPI0037833569